MRERWAEAGLVTRDEMQTNCCYALQDKTWVHDPDGNEWEAFVVLEDNLTETAICCVTAKAEQSDAQASIGAATTTTADTATAATAEEVSCCGTQPQTVEISGVAR
jgi:hypothetical protein